MNKFKKFRSFLLGSLLSLSFTLPATAASNLQNSKAVEIQRSDVIAFPHAKKRQSTGSWKNNRDKHQNLPKALKELKRQAGNWTQKGEKTQVNSAKKNSRAIIRK